MLQKNASEQMYSVDLGYFLKEQEFYLLAGVNYRYNDATVLYVGARKGSFMGKVAYDANVSSLRDVSKYKGAFEISLTYIGKKSKSKEVRHCPRL